MTENRYRAASGAGGKRPWRVIYDTTNDDRAGHFELVDTRGSIVRFGSFETASARAATLNRRGLPPKIKILGNTFWLMP